MANILEYVTEDIDYDGSYFFQLRDNIDFFYFHNCSNKIAECLNYYYNKIADFYEDFPFIIGNYLYFTLDGKKFFTCISNCSKEWDFVDDFIKDLRKLGCDNVCYEYGRYD